MIRFLFTRILLALAVAVAVSIAAFALLHALGDPAIAIAGEGATASDIEAVRQQFGFDRPLPVQYVEWIGRVIQGDFGESFYYRRPVRELIVEHIPTTLKLGLASIVFALSLSLPLGIAAAVRPNSWIDRASLGLAVFGQAIPSFWLGLILIITFAVRIPILPASGADTWLHFVLPTIVLGYYAAPALMRLTRAGLIEVLESDYIRTARAKGILPTTVLFKHALRNALIPVVSLAAVQFGFMLSGSIVTETVFALNGLGYLAWGAISRADLPVVQMIILTFSVLYIGLTLAADLVNAWLDPRIRTA
jgi:peptide/nickel transport system permease protein